ncbi:MAG: RNA-binding protein [Lachnospiraceae bacterium]|nr:RNA-binding protein [Lachnospiraceae bacterium]
MKIGTYQTLKVLYKKDFGIFLGNEGDERGILLPKNQVAGEINVGDDINVFLYKDSEDRIIATTKRPKIALGELALLEIKEISKIGAFLDWGIDKDLLLPFKEQTGKLMAGDKVLVYMYSDKSDRLCATMNIYKHLKSDSPYNKGDEVTGTVYGINPEMGVFVAVDNMYYGMLPKQKAFKKYRISDSVKLFVDAVREDGKLNLSEGRSAYLQMNDDADKILSVIDEFGGELPFGEKADPSVIAREFSMSKAAFKRALGHLYKEGKVELGPDAIRRK